MKVLKARTLAFILAITWLSASPTFAACGKNRVPTYSDIEAVRYARTSCFGPCPEYSVLFWGSSLWYVGQSHVSRRGTYESRNSEALKNAIVVLKKHDYFSLNHEPSNESISDTAHYVISVQRCGVSTMSEWLANGTEADIEAIVNGLDNITKQVHWRKTGNSTATPENGIAPIPY